MGFSPSPSSTITEFTRKGFDVKIINKINIRNKALCIFKTIILNSFWDLLNKE